MAHENLGLFLEMGRHDDRGDILLDRRKGLNQAAAQVEIELADGHEHSVCGARPAGHNGDLQPVFLESAIGDRLIISAVLGLRDPVRAERDFPKGLRSESAAPKRACRSGKAKGTNVSPHDRSSVAGAPTAPGSAPASER